MKSIASIFVLCMLGGGAAVTSVTTATAATLTGTHGSSLTTYNGASGAMNNNEWNSVMNNRSSNSGGRATADFGNCNSVILRCASPKCSNGGCTTMDIAVPIVTGCVSSNNACKQYGNDLIQSIAAQLVASSNAKTSAQITAAQAASDAAAQQSAAQLEQMQREMTQSMQQMQLQMAEQNAKQVQELREALDAQKELTAQALAEAQSATVATQPTGGALTSSGSDTTASATVATDTPMPKTTVEALTQAQIMAVNAGVPTEILARDQLTGKILSDLESAEKALADAKAAMKRAFDYAGCDDNATSCSGPKRVSAFRRKALEFFEPYNTAVKELSRALDKARLAGVDISDIYMMLNESCNTWAQYLCTGGRDANGDWATYDRASCPRDGGPSQRSRLSNGQNPECYYGTTIPPEDSAACTLNHKLDDMEEVQRNFLYAGIGDTKENIRVGCMSSVLTNSRLFGSISSNQKMISLETLQRIISQDAPSYSGGNSYSRSSDTDETNKLKYCALTSNGYMELERAVSTKKLPNRVCVRDETLSHTWLTEGNMSVAASESLINSGYGAGGSNPDYRSKQKCENSFVSGTWENGKCVCKDGQWTDGQCKKVESKKWTSFSITDAITECSSAGGKFDAFGDTRCHCTVDKQVINPNIGERCISGIKAKKVNL